MQEALGQASDGIFAVVALYMQEQEARDLVQQLLDRLSSHSSRMHHRDDGMDARVSRLIDRIVMGFMMVVMMIPPTAMIRRAISSVIVAVCAHYPKNQLAFVLRSVLLRHSALFPALAGHNNSNASDTEQAASADETSSPVRFATTTTTPRTATTLLTWCLCISSIQRPPPCAGFTHLLDTNRGVLHLDHRLYVSTPHSFQSLAMP